MKKFNLTLAKKQFGIGLLELMLSLSIIAVLLVMATRYYMSTAMNSRITQTIDAIMGLPAAAECWAGSGSNTDHLGTYTDLDLLAMSTEKCFPVALVNQSTKQLLTPYGDMKVTGEQAQVCVEVKAGSEGTPKEEIQQIAGKICKNTNTDTDSFVIANISSSTAGFVYEAIGQSCAAAGEVTKLCPVAKTS